MLNFSNTAYKEKALSTQMNPENIHSSVDAILLLIKGVAYDDLSNLCELMKEHYASLPNPIKLSLEDCYKLTQNDNLSEIEKNTIAELISKCIKSGKTLGNKTIMDGKINTSSWISHCFYSGEVCASLANQLGLDSDKARTMGILHDYGRKFDHSFGHTIGGFEKLTDLGWDNEAIGCLTHSFVNGGRCSNNEPALDGFYLDKYGNANWKSDVPKDDMGLFLDNYAYSDYDILLNIADLMATDKGIVSPKVRIEDIATRRVFIDPTNRGYFLSDITNTFIDILKRLNMLPENIVHIKDDENTSLEQIENYFNEVSTYFFGVFTNFPNIDKQNTK